jgi:hypothetical protein
MMETVEVKLFVNAKERTSAGEMLSRDSELPKSREAKILNLHLARDFFEFSPLLLS